MLHKITIPVNIHIAPLMAIIVEVGCEENSFNTSRHASDVQTLIAFHIVSINTSHSRRVTRKGCLLMVFSWMEDLKVWKQSPELKQAGGSPLKCCLGGASISIN
jgi:hypothetical protein